MTRLFVGLLLSALMILLNVTVSAQETLSDQIIKAFNAELNTTGSADLRLLSVQVNGRQITLNFNRAASQSPNFQDSFQRGINAIYLLPDFKLTDVEFITLIEGTPLTRETPPLILPAAPSTPNTLRGPLSGRSVTLSAGHGWTWYERCGCYRFQRNDWWGIVEDKVNAEIIMELYTLLTNAGATVYVTRNRDKNAGNGPSGYPRWEENSALYLESIGIPASIWNTGSDAWASDLRARPLYANYRNSDILINFHNNGGCNNGCGWNGGTYILYDSTNGYQTESYRLAKSVESKLIARIRGDYAPSWRNRGVAGFDGDYGENRLATRPAILIEGAFMDQQYPDNAFLQDAHFRRLLAFGTYEGILDYFGLNNQPGVPEIVSPLAETVVYTPFNVSLRPGTLNYTGQADYRVQIDNQADFSSPEFDNVIRDGRWSTSTTISIPALPNGPYYLRAQQGDTVANSGGWTTSRLIYIGYRHMGNLSYGVTQEASFNGEQRWRLNAQSTNVPIIFDIQRRNGTLTGRMILRDANGTILAQTRTSSTGRGLISYAGPISGTLYLHYVPNVGTQGTYGIAAWANAIPSLPFIDVAGWEWHDAHTDFRSWRANIGTAQAVHFVFMRIDGSFEANWRVSDASGNVLAAGRTGHGYASINLIASGVVFFEFTPDSAGSYRIAMRRGSTESVANGDFELGGQPALHWTGGSLYRDALNCGGLGHLSACGFTFAGDPGQTAYLQQWLDHQPYQIGDRAILAAVVSGRNVSVGGEIRAMIRYSDGTRSRLRIVVPPGTYAYQPLAVSRLVVGTVSSLNVSAVMIEGSGRFTVDRISLSRIPSASLPTLAPLIRTGDPEALIPMP
ncbi:MAG: N-acetylmuramoyl-L-alanine amidase [Anaerolineae bacterium]|jgi:N-acetylmuramoyl-L-alanine amidase|nr:N-acetylmuramoyl-L-alanine amidase [Anaerolineae bacterium]